MNVYGCQFNVCWEDKTSNFETVARMIQDLKPVPGSLVALPELFATGFSMNSGKIAEAINGETASFLSQTARENNIWLVGGAAIRQGDQKPGNDALVFNPQGERVVDYAKMRPFSPGGEHKAYRAGERHASFKWQGITVGVLICYDLRFPELFRAALSHGEAPPELFMVIASWPESRAAQWVRLLQARAIENQAYVLGVNRSGTDPMYAYPGRSVFVSPQGDILSDAGDEAGWAQGTIDLSSLVRYRDKLPFLRDYRKV
jgi:predicted amidohydrolase